MNNMIWLVLASRAVADFSANVNPNYVGSAPSYQGSPPGGYGAVPTHKFACSVLQGTNSHRASKYRKPLLGDRRLDKSAMLICQNMARLNDLDHNAGGNTPGQRLEMMGYDWNKVAENIYDETGYGPPDPSRAVNGWIKSPGHEVNMVGDYDHMGSAYCTGAGGKVYWAQVCLIL